MVLFAGWDMPIQYSSGINHEHIAVRTDVGLFDVSHMGEIRVTGTQAVEFLSFATLNNPASLKPGRGQYSMLPNDRGGLIDDLYIYCLAENTFMVVCNAANVDKVVPHLLSLAQDYDVNVRDESDDWALLALQGPGAALMLERQGANDLTALKKNRLKPGELLGKDIILSRTGYTGEDGFEIFCRPDDATLLWQTLIEAGATPCGLGARDTLRLEAGFPLYGHEFSETTNPLCTDYAWVVKDKPFFGREAMWAPECKQRLVGITLTRRGIARQGYKLFDGDIVIGEVTSGTISPLTREGIAMGWINQACAAPNQAIAVEIRGQKVAATVTKPPFYSQ